MQAASSERLELPSRTPPLAVELVLLSSTELAVLLLLVLPTEERVLPLLPIVAKSSSNAENLQQQWNNTIHKYATLQHNSTILPVRGSQTCRHYSSNAPKYCSNTRAGSIGVVSRTVISTQKLALLLLTNLKHAKL